MIVENLIDMKNTLKSLHVVLNIWNCTEFEKLAIHGISNSALQSYQSDTREFGMFSDLQEKVTIKMTSTSGVW